MADLADFLPDVQPFCAGVPVPIAERAILHATREFCEESGWWRSEQTFTTVTDESGTGEYTLTLASGQNLVSVITPIHHSNYPVTLKTEEWLTEQYALDWRTKTAEQAKHFTMSSKVIVRLVPYPTVAVANDLRVWKILKPALTSPTVDDTIRDDWSEQIGLGALARLNMQIGQPWGDANLAAVRYAQFREAVREAKAKAVAKWQDRRHQKQRRTVGHHF